MQLKIASLNINGFNKSSDQLARFIISHNIHFTCIQETHTIQHQQLSHFSHKNNFLSYSNTDHSLTAQAIHRQGTLTIINTQHIQLNSQMITSHIILPNHIHSLSFTLTGINYVLINCYLPSGKTAKQTTQRIKAIKTLTSFLHNFDYKNNLIIIAGDFNLVLNPIDRTGHFTPNTNDKILFQTILSNFDLIDSYRSLYPHSKTFSFSRSLPISRLDRIYIPSSLISKITQSSYHNISFSDHNKAPIITLKTPSKTKFKASHWKLNNSILATPTNQLYIKSFIETLLNPINPIAQPLKWWDQIKSKIKSRIIYYSKTQQNNIRKTQNSLQTKLNKAKQLEHHEEIALISQKLEQIQLNRQKGIQIRARIPLLSSIDSPSPLAAITENLTQSKSLLPAAPNTTPSTSTNPTNPNNFSSFLSFFRNLWNPTSTHPDPTKYLDEISAIIPDDILQTLPSSPLITYDDIRTAIKTLNQNSSPGLDGFTPCLYITFPSLIPILCQTFNNSFIRKQLTYSQSLALIKLIPKTPNPKSVKDWRPISLLNTDYKILSTIISSRLKPILNSVISPEQQCGLPNRQIFNNHLNILSVINYSKDLNQLLAIVQIDFYKAFDSISHEYILSTASKLGIPDSLLKWIQIFLYNLSARLNLNGSLSDLIPVKCGIRQGCPLSMLLFLIGIEPLTKKILSSPKIQGISLGTSSLKVTHYADDLSLFISSPQSFPVIREIIEQFSLYSGLKINQSKTSIISNSPDLISSFHSSFPKGKTLSSTKILGITFSFQNEDLSKNWDDLIHSLPHSTLATLNPKDTLFSKVISINQHVLPKILFLSRIILPTPKQTKTLTTLLFKFLWNYSPFEPIRRSTLYLPKSDGGIGLPSIGFKTSTAFLWKLILLLKSPKNQPYFWIKYGLYNIGTKILPLKPELYSNSQPHRPKPNPLWTKTLSLFKKSSISAETLDELTFKSLYQLLLKPDPNPIPSINSNTPHNWLRLTLAKPRPSLFSNHEKEISYRTAYKGYTWGCFFSKHNFKPRNPNDFHCKLCSSPSDDPHHLFYHCPIAQHLISALEPLLTTALKQPTTLTQDTLLYNYTNTTGTTHVIISKLASLIRLSLFNVKNYSSLYHKPIPSSFLNDEKFKIKTKFKTFIQQYFPDNVRKT